jgi:flagellar basal body-associated protein FliL
LPYSKQHQAQKRKNYALLIVLLVLMALVYAISIMRMGGA